MLGLLEQQSQRVQLVRDGDGVNGRGERNGAQFDVAEHGHAAHLDHAVDLVYKVTVVGQLVDPDVVLDHQVRHQHLGLDHDIVDGGPGFTVDVDTPAPGRDGS